MARRFLRFLLPSALVLAAALLARRTVNLRAEVFRVAPSRDPWAPITEAERPEPSDRDDREDKVEAPAGATWVAPVDRACPPTHVIKAKEASGIYHLPGMANYNRTRPDRCYAEESAAQADDFTKSTR